MSETYPPIVQRPALLSLAEAAGTCASVLRRDDCGDWAIFGSNGHIYAVPEGYQLMIGCDLPKPRWTSAKGWESAKRRLGFGKVSQDGDMEGSIIPNRLPTQAEAVQIRVILGIPKRVEFSEEALAAKRTQFSMVAKMKGVLPPKRLPPLTLCRNASAAVIGMREYYSQPRPAKRAPRRGGQGQPFKTPARSRAHSNR